MRVATSASRFGYPIARTLGNTLAGSVLSRGRATVGEPLTREMLLASRLISAERAHAVGELISVLPDGAAMEAEVIDLFVGVVQASRATIETTKQQLLKQTPSAEAKQPQ